MRNTRYSEMPKAAATVAENDAALRALFLTDIRNYPAIARELQGSAESGGFYYANYQRVARTYGGETL